MPSQPIHETIKISNPKNAREGERFELTWSMIKALTCAAVSANGNLITVFSQRTTSKTFNDMAIALEIILQCKTFSPGFFEKKKFNWVRVGDKANAE